MGFRGVEKKLNGCLRKVSKVFQGCFKGILSVFQRRLWGCFERPFRVIQWSFKVSKISSKGVSRLFQRCFKDVSRVFKESVKCASRKLHQKFQGCIKNLKMEFLLQFCCMNLIATTRAEGGLVYFGIFCSFSVSVCVSVRQSSCILFASPPLCLCFLFVPPCLCILFVFP